MDDTTPIATTGEASGAREAATTHRRIGMLDGWRAVSILAVMAGHLLPLGPAS